MSAHGVQRFFLVVLLLMIVAGPAFAETTARPPRTAAIAPASAAVVRAGSGSLGSFVSSGGRTRIVQFCAVVMCIALFIMMRKLT